MRRHRAAKEADVGVVDEDVLWIERVELHAVGSGDVEAAGCPSIVRLADRVELRPGLSAIEGAVGSKEVGGVADVGVIGGDGEAVRGVEEDASVTV